MLAMVLLADDADGYQWSLGAVGLPIRHPIRVAPSGDDTADWNALWGTLVLHCEAFWPYSLLTTCSILQLNAVSLGAGGAP
jgi:hypothetical protein